MSFDVRVALESPALLGEGPVWHAGEQALWYCDIPARRIHRLARLPEFLRERVVRHRHS